MLLAELMLLTEARDPGLSYTEKRVKNLLDRVTVELAGSKSGVMSKLTNRYSRLDKLAKQLTARREELNAVMKEKAEALFDVTDNVLTRVVETVSFTITLSKAEKAADKKPKKVIDFEAVVKELQTMVPELEEQMKALIEKYTEIIAAKDTPVALRVKSKIDESVLSDAWKSVKALGRSVMSWAKGYDRRLADLKALANA